MPIFLYRLDCDPSGELSTQKPAYLTSHDIEDKSQYQLLHLLYLCISPLENLPVAFATPSLLRTQKPLTHLFVYLHNSTTLFSTWLPMKGREKDIKKAFLNQVTDLLLCLPTSSHLPLFFSYCLHSPEPGVPDRISRADCFIEGKLACL